MTSAVELIEQTLETYNIDEDRVYTMGTSAGTKSAVATDIAFPVSRFLCLPWDITM